MISYKLSFFNIFDSSLLYTFKYGEKIQNAIYFSDYTIKGYMISTILAITFFTICLASISSSTFNPFIYFRF